MQKVRIYTCSGDKGRTSLGNGKRVVKDDLRIQVLGDVDEANAAIGVARVYAPSELEKILKTLQNHLFNLGAELCFPFQDNHKKTIRFSPEVIKLLETWIDEYDENIAPLRTFILPGGSEASAYLHLARTIVRRAERAIVHLDTQETVSPYSLMYVNRLSDLLFVLARHCNNKGQEDILWDSSVTI